MAIMLCENLNVMMYNVSKFVINLNLQLKICLVCTLRIPNLPQFAILALRDFAKTKKFDNLNYLKLR